MTSKLRNILTVLLSCIFILSFSLWSIFRNPDEKSSSERRQLAQFPQFSRENLLNGNFMKDFESYSLDQFPMRDSFRTLKTLSSLYAFRQKDNNDIYVADGYASKLDYPIDNSSLSYAAQRFEYVYNKYLVGSDCKAYLSIIPDKNKFLANDNGYLSFDYDELVKAMADKCSFAQYIDIFPQLSLEDYYITDTHWRQDKITAVANCLAKGMGVGIDENYSLKSTGKDFYGVYYGQSALPLKADEINYLTNNSIESCKVFDYETNKEISVYDLKKTDGDDGYEMFLDGSKSLLTIENSNAETDRELIMFRDSFSSSLAPLLVSGYKKITLVDIRYISPAILDRFIDFKNSDVLFIYSSLVLNNSITIK